VIEAAALNTEHFPVTFLAQARSQHAFLTVQSGLPVSKNAFDLVAVGFRNGPACPTFLFPESLPLLYRHD